MKNRYADLVGHLASVKISGIEEVENISFVRVIDSTARLTDSLIDLMLPERSQNLTSLDNAADIVLLNTLLYMVMVERIKLRFNKLQKAYIMRFHLNMFQLFKI